MENTVSFRDFEERDIDFVYKCKNDAKLNSMIVGDYHPFTYEEATKWVHGCQGEHETYKFWAVCTNDEERRIIGWVSLSHIDKVNSSAQSHGILIADPEFRDGSAYRESSLFVNNYVFHDLKLNRLTGSCLKEHILSRAKMEADYWTLEGIERESIFKNGQYHDVMMYITMLFCVENIYITLRVEKQTCSYSFVD